MKDQFVTYSFYNDLGDNYFSQINLTEDIFNQIEEILFMLWELEPESPKKFREENFDWLLFDGVPMFSCVVNTDKRKVYLKAIPYESLF